MIINTHGMSFERWAAAVNQQLGYGGDNVRVIEGEPWQEWAYRVLLLPSVQTQNAPRPAYYQEWNDWGDAFNRTVIY